MEGLVFQDGVRLKVLLEVTQEQWDSSGVNCDTPGFYLFYGFWHDVINSEGKPVKDPLDFRCYGKIEDFRPGELMPICHISCLDLTGFS